MRQVRALVSGEHLLPETNSQRLSFSWHPAISTITGICDRNSGLKSRRPAEGSNKDSASRLPPEETSLCKLSSDRRCSLAVSQPTERPFEIYDSRLSGFTLRVQPSGVRSYYARFGRKLQGVPLAHQPAEGVLLLDLEGHLSVHVFTVAGGPGDLLEPASGTRARCTPRICRGIRRLFVGAQLPKGWLAEPGVQ